MNVRYRFMTATLLCLSMGSFSFAQAADCDVDTDGDVDRQDLSLIISARDKPASGPDDTRDADGDGTITMLDARTCVKQCNLKGCTIIEPTPPPPKPTPTEDVRQPDVPEATPVQKAVKDVSKPEVATSDQSTTKIQTRKIVGGTEWRVKSGDTLYAIGRAVYPGDARKQARLRQDIMKLNPSVFANGANKMAVGVVLKLPDYVVSKAAPPKVSKTAKAPKPAPVEVTPKPSPKPAAPAPVVEPEPEIQRKVSSVPTPAQGNVVASLGYAYGGDKLVYEDGSYDPAGAAAHARLGYEQMYQHGGGYRAALGLQYGVADSASFKDIYLQVAYQYRADPFIYGIGVILSEGATREDDSTVDYDAANGAVVYLENVGSSDLAGWGLSYTSLDIEDEDTSESFDASRAELYYSWRF